MDNEELLRELRRTFQSPGWQYMTAQWTGERDALVQSTFFGAGSFEEVQEARVRYSLLTELIGMPKDVEVAAAQHEQAPSEDG